MSANSPRCHTRLLWLALSLLPLPAFAHAFLTTASPRVGATLPTAPPQLRLNFTEGVEPGLSKVIVRNQAGATVSLGHCRQGGRPNQLILKLSPLPPGAYQVTWHAVATDLHKTQGNFTFHVGP